MNDADVKIKKQIVDKIKESTNILVTVSNNPSVDDLSAALGLSAILNKLDKHATAIFSGAIPPAITFLDPSKVFEDSADSLRDFIIALDKEKADHLRYKVEGDLVKIFITPYHTTITSDDLEFSQGDFNVELVLALGVENQDSLDAALAAHGRILHEVTVATLCAGQQTSRLGRIDWRDEKASSLCEMVTDLADSLKTAEQPILDKQISTALLTGIVAATDRFSNPRTSSRAMTLAAQLMAAGADQQLIAAKLQESHTIQSIPAVPIPGEQQAASPTTPAVATGPGLPPGSIAINHAPDAVAAPVTGDVFPIAGASAAPESVIMPPAPVPVPAPAPTPAPVSEPLPEPAPEPAPIPEQVTTPEPTTEAVTTLAPESAPESTPIAETPESTLPPADDSVSTLPQPVYIEGSSAASTLAPAYAPESTLPPDSSTEQSTTIAPAYALETEPEPTLEPTPEPAPEPAPEATPAPAPATPDQEAEMAIPKPPPIEQLPHIEKTISSAPSNAIEPSLGGSLNAESSDAAEQKRRELEDAQNKKILTHSYLGSVQNTFNKPVSSADQADDDGESVDIFADGPMSQTQPSFGLPMPPSVPDFSSLPPAPMPAASPAIGAAVSPAEIAGTPPPPPVPVFDPGQYRIPGQ